MTTKRSNYFNYSLRRLARNDAILVAQDGQQALELRTPTASYPPARPWSCST